jgi:CO/xanthine dehydrogenase Mo-binding subunit
VTTEAPPRPTTGQAQVGRSVPRVDAAEKLRGEAAFVGDMTVPRMLYGKVLRSDLPHAHIRDIDTAAAEAIPGVIAILTGRDFLDSDPYWGHAIKDRPIVAIDKVRHVGEPVAAVAAVDEATADAAIRAIEVDYEELPVVGTIEEALASDAPLVQEGPIRPGLFHGLALDTQRDGNICYRYGMDRGDVDGIFADAAIVVEGDYEFPGVYQYAMETHTVLADAAGSDITVWATCQHPFLVRAELAELFGVSLSQVRVIVPYLGGGFGSKSYTKMEPVTVALSRKAGRPVRIQNRVDESMATTRRHGARFHMRTAANADGRLLARDVKVAFDTGAYADNGPRVVATGGDAAPGPYRWSAVRVDATCVHTNTSPSGSYRAFGASHLQWAGELQVDEVGRRAGVDPLQMRQRNLLRPGEDVRPGGKPLDADLVGDIEKAAADLGWGTPLPEGHGRGLSVGLLAAGAHPVSSAVVRLEADGQAIVLVGSTEMGQGQRTAFAQIAAETLSMATERVRCLGTDTQFTPYDRSTGASRSTTLAGMAVHKAAAEVREDLLDIARTIWPDAAEDPELRDGRAWSGSDSHSYPELIAKRFGLSGGQLIGEGGVHPKGTGSYAEGPVFWEVCVAAAEVSVDRETGAVRVERTATVADVGRAINPQLIERQDEGATMQGIGNALFEEMNYQDGLLLNDNLLEYRVPSIDDLPAHSSCIIVENEDGPGPFGAKGCGEGAFAGVIGAIATAVADTGVPVNELPLTPERVWRSIRSIEEEVGS